MSGAGKWTAVTTAALIAALCLTARAHAFDLYPDALAIEAQHVSHVTQHQPFTATPTNYGYEAIDLALKWRYGPLQLVVSDGLILGTCVRYTATLQTCGSSIGPRETFNARVSYDMWSR